MPMYNHFLIIHLDESHGIHFDGILRQPEWQAKTVRSSSKSVIKGALALQKATEREDRSTKKNSDASSTARKSNKKLGLVSTSK